ncbi:CarD family transcriptional regulator [Clostridia bacterium]|nr:CarD family transcriptional regulator [Clostridia bacterium]GHU74474.1 CarD family transcriptional regulator [Clostridia bacterium]
MFSKGDKIVYPLYGAGVIESIEEKEIEGTFETYYTLNIPSSNLKIMISASKAETCGIRVVYSKDEIVSIIKSTKEKNPPMSENWNERYRSNMEKIKTGHLREIAVVFRNLQSREKLKVLSGAEKKMLTTTKQIIISEIAVSQNIEKNLAEEILLEAVGS